MGITFKYYLKHGVRGRSTQDRLSFLFNLEGGKNTKIIQSAAIGELHKTLTNTKKSFIFSNSIFWWLVILNIFLHAYWPFASPFWKKCLFKSSALLKSNCFTYLFLLLSFINSFYILDINLLLDIQFACVFFHLVGYLFILLMVSFAMQKLFSLV